MSNNVHTAWLAATGGQGRSFIIRGWYPAEIDWEIEQLCMQVKKLSKLTIVFDERPGCLSGGQPEVLFDQLPIPLFPADDYVIEMFSPYWDGFHIVRVKTGFVRENNRFDKWGKSIVLAPSPEVIYTSPDEVPAHRDMAVIARRFCITTTLYERHAFYFRDVIFTPYADAPVLPTPSTPDFSSAFAKRVKVPESHVEETIVTFILDRLRHYQGQYAEKLTALLLDCDPQYGYVILALKQSPVTDLARIEIDDFEFDQYAVLEASELYGGATYLSASRMRVVLKRVIERLTRHELVMALAASPALHIAYAFHDEEIRWPGAALPPESSASRG